MSIMEDIFRIFDRANRQMLKEKIMAKKAEILKLQHELAQLSSFPTQLGADTSLRLAPALRGWEAIHHSICR